MNLVGQQVAYEGDTWEVVWQQGDEIQICNHFGGSQFVNVYEVRLEE